MSGGDLADIRTTVAPPLPVEGWARELDRRELSPS